MAETREISKVRGTKTGVLTQQLARLRRCPVTVRIDEGGQIITVEAQSGS